MKRVVCGSLLCWMFAIVSSEPAASEPACSTFPAKIPAPALDLAPPRGFIEVCSSSQESALCKEVEPQFTNATALGFFVNQDEWKVYKQSSNVAKITRLLIAQWFDKAPAGTFLELQKATRSRHENDPAEPVFGTDGQAAIAVFEDAKDSIAAGSLTRVAAKPGQPESTKAVINVALLDGSRRLLTLTVMDANASPKGESAKALASEWLRCMRAASK